MTPVLAEVAGAVDEAIAHHEPTLGVTLLFASILVALIACLALEEKLHAKKSVIAGIFAVVCLFLGDVFRFLPLGPVEFAGHEIEMPIYIPAVDWSVIAIIFGSSLFVDVTSRSGLFTWIAIRLTKTSRGDPLLLLVFYGVMTVVFSAVLNNVTAMIIVGSLTAVSLGKLGKKELLLGFLLIEGLLTNIGGLLTLISSVPNIIVGTKAEISFVRFFVTAAPYVVVATAATLFLGAKRFGVGRLGSEEEKLGASRLVAGFDENDSIESRGFFWFGTGMTILFIAVIASTSFLPYVRDLGMGYVALAFGAIMLVRFKAVADRFYQAIDWDLLGFFAALFVVINVMEHAGVLELIGHGVEAIVRLPELASSSAVLISAAAFSSVTDNIPLAAMLAQILDGLGTAKAGEPEGLSALWWSVVFGANLGGNLTPIGSASTLVAVTVMHKHGLEMTFGRFVKLAIPFAIAHLLLAVAYVAVLVLLGG